MQFFGQFGSVQGAQAGIEIRWFVNLVDEAPLGAIEHPGLFPERCSRAASPLTAASPLAVPELASLDVAPSGAPLALPPLNEPPASSLGDAAPLELLDPDSPADPELRPAPASPIPEPAAAPAAAAPLPAPSVPVPLVPLGAEPGLVWLALHAATMRTAQQNGPANPRLMSASVGMRPRCDHRYGLHGAPHRVWWVGGHEAR